MGAICRAIAASVFAFLAVGPALAQQPVVPAAAPSNLAEELCAKYFPAGTSYRGTEYRRGKSTGVTITYTRCEEMASAPDRPKLYVHYERQRDGAALEKHLWLEYMIEDGGKTLKWRLMHEPYGVKARLLILNTDGSYIEKLEYTDGTKDDVRFKRK